MTRKIMVLLLLLLLLAFLVAGCGSDPEPQVVLPSEDVQLEAYQSEVPSADCEPTQQEELSEESAGPQDPFADEFPSGIHPDSKLSDDGLWYYVDFKYENQPNNPNPRRIITGCTDIWPDMQLPMMIDKEFVYGVYDWAFAGNTTIVSLEIPPFYTIMESAFEGCTSLKTVVNADMCVFEARAFAGCTSLTVAPSMDEIPDYCFYGCTALTEDGLDLESVKFIGEAAFAKTGLRKIELSPATVSLGDYAFYDCPELHQISIPWYCNRLGKDCFSNIRNIVMIVEKGSAAEEYARKNKIDYIIP